MNRDQHYSEVNHAVRMSYDLPDYVRDQAGGKNARYLVKEVIEQCMPDIHCTFGFDAEADNPMPMILVGRTNFPDMYAGSRLGLNSEAIAIDAFAAGPDREPHSEELCEATVQNLMRAWANGYVSPNGYGHFNHIRRMDGPVIGDDWGPSLGPVQYADSPSSITRCRAIVVVRHRKPTNLTLERP